MAALIGSGTPLLGRCGRLHHRDPDDVGERVDVLVPHPRQQLLGRQDGAVGAQQFGQHGELAVAQRDRPVAAANLPPGQVDAQVTAPDHRGQGGPGAPYQRVHPRRQLREGERLGQVVVGAQAQSGDAVADRRGCGEHEHPRLHPRLDHRPAHLIAVDDRQVAIQHDHVVVVDAEPFQRLVPVIGHVDGQRLAAQPLRDGVREEFLVLDHQDTHFEPAFHSRRRGVRRALLHDCRPDVSSP
jgi:hypothetical protein